MGTNWRRPAFLILAVTAITAAAAFLNSKLTRYVESAEFRAEMEKETARGLHFPGSKFGPIRRTGMLSAGSASFRAQDGRKAMTSLDAHDIAGRFNPLGIFLRRWQLDELHIARGEVGIQVYEPKPEPTPTKPWYHVFLPDRVYLKRVWSDPADITWQMRGAPGGIFGTHLEITPHGRDFNYRAIGGTLKNALVPDLPLREARLRITKELFTLCTLDLSSDAGSIHGAGTAETRGDKRADFKINWDKLPVREWVPESWKGNFAGAAAGELHWTGGLKLEAAKIEGASRISGGRLSQLPFLEQLAAVTQRADFARLELNECAADVTWDKGRGTLQNIALEDRGKFRIEGTVSFAEESLGGTIELGLGRPYLAWLPKAEELFPRERDGYLWTTVHLSGTLAAPEQDLSPRLVEALKETPFSFFGAAFRALGAWLRGD
ncbi:MAG TPA: hypothetical protein VK474_05620 [Chthoniobacterales bacterium]|nr:hypothetical protein [Chthoniobacterales bacterium]